MFGYSLVELLVIGGLVVFSVGVGVWLWREDRRLDRERAAAMAEFEAQRAEAAELRRSRHR